MLLIFSALGFGIVIGPCLDLYAGLWGMARSLFMKAI